MKMTTIEIENVTALIDLVDACMMAGTGGIVQRDGLNYVVGVDNNGNYTLSHEGGPAEPRRTYLQTGWRAVNSVIIDSDDEDDEESTITTVADFFYGISFGTLVFMGPDSTTEYMYAANEYTNEGVVEKIVMVHLRYGQVTRFDASVENRWETREDEDGEAKTATQSERRLADSLVSVSDENRIMSEQLSKRADESLSLRKDFALLNTKINEYADETQMCGDYERRIFEWNNDFESDMRLKGRPMRYSVPVNLPAGLRTCCGTTFCAQVIADSGEEAKAIVEGYTRDQFLQAIRESSCDLEDFNFTVSEDDPSTFSANRIR